MTYRDAKTMTARGQIQYRFVQRAARATSAYQCLILSTDPRRGDMLERAASDGGWKTCVCANATTAMAHLSRAFVHLAIVDLQDQPLKDFRPVLEQLTSRGGLLLIVCGNEGDLQEEVWVRQLGAWLYLPGVTETSNLALLCGEARQIAERIARVPAPDRAGKAPAARETYS
jgi:DNA-binding NtrC family response regulator